MNHCRRLITPTLAILFLFSGCTGFYAPRPNLSTASIPQSRTIRATISPQLLFTPTSTETAYKATNTPRPTLSTFEINRLIEINGGCIFPCWLGIVPGQTIWNEVEPVLSTFVSINYQTNDPRIELINEDRNLLNYIEVRDGIVTFIYSFEPLQKTPIWKTLSIYGRPQEIRIYPSGNYYGLGLNPYGEFTLVFFYPDLGIMASYSGRTNAGKILHLCLEEPTLYPHTNWLLWDPKELLTFTQAGDKLRLPAKEMKIGMEYLPIEEVTNISVDTFYQTYKIETNTTECFDVQDPDWINR